ncbi:putative aliphatic sulfonates-binding protein precursor [Sporotomaculum syntrophicum]|uniref:Aliphatic sulfonates-binding protein n=1 Tax=Sporotomaculum syntrophicum TaxID=182264 RepID=A0A9D3AXG8_9FIRM|nr:ABC transporter substrate-binding protein [Sporotomaculum syntrophicum]KAF1086695.1 putative aliphatic sulfonates-binding protein precursor [Sporotomaculum syntrophicum]
MKKKLSAIILCLVMLFALAGCGSETPGNETAAAPTDDVLKVSVAAQSNSGQVFQYMAEEHNFLKEEGVDVEMVYINNGTDAFQALVAGKVDVLSTYGTGGPLIQIANGQDFTIFSGYMITGETPCFGKPETEWTSLESFRGKKIGITRFGTPDVVLKGVLYDAGLLDEVTFIEFKKNQEVLQAVSSGEVDFGATATGYELQAADLGLEVKMWPDDYWPNHSCCRVLAKGSWMQDETNQEALYRMLRAWLRAEEAMQGNYDEVVDLVVKKLDLDKATVESFVKSPHMKYDNDPYKNSVIKMWNKMTDFGYIADTKVQVEEHINTEIYKRALDSLIKDYPDSQFFKDKLVQFNENNA